MNSRHIFFFSSFPFFTSSSAPGEAKRRKAGKRKDSQSSSRFQPTNVSIRIMPSVTDVYSPAIAFCEASAMITSINISAMPTAPTSRLTIKRNTKNKNQ